MANEVEKEQLDILSKSKEVLESIKGKISGLAAEFTELGTSSSRASAMIADVNTNIGKLSPTITQMSSYIFGASKAFSNFKVEGSTAISNVTKQFHEFVENVNDIPLLGGLAKSLNINVDKLSGMKELKNVVLDAGTKFLQAAAGAQELQTNFLHLLSSTGQLSSVMKDGVIDTTALDEKMTSFSLNLTNVAKATGFSTDQVAQFAAELGKIPGVLDESIRFGEQNARVMTELETATKLASGTGQSLNTVTSFLNNQYENFSQKTGRNALQTFAFMNEAAQKLGLRFDDVKNFTMDISNSMKMFGDETEGSLRVLNRYTDALKSTGLGAAASKDLIEGMVKSVGNLTTGTKAFLSARSGGPGGLQGAFQIDKLLREGKIDEVTKMLESNLKKQLGGKIVSLEQAATSPQAAQQYQKQISMIQSGAFGGLAKTGAEAERLLDALASGNVGKAAELLDSSKSLENTVEGGTKLQEQQINILGQINAGIEAMVGIGSLQAKETLKGWTAAGEGIISKYTKETAMIANQKSTDYKALSGMSKEQGSAEAVYGFLDTFAGLPKAIGDSVKEKSVKEEDKKVPTEIKMPVLKTETKPVLPQFTDLGTSFKAPVDKFSLSVSDFAKSVEKTEMPKAADIAVSPQKTKAEDFAMKTAALEERPIKITVEGVCIDCGEKKIKAEVEKGLTAIKSSPYNPGSYS